MDPIRWDSDPTIDKVQLALVGSVWSGQDYEYRSPSAALLSLPQTFRARELELTYISGKPFYLATETPSQTILLPVASGLLETIEPRLLNDAVANAASPYKVVETRLVTQYEIYYVDRERRKRLPALYLRLNDANDSAFYIDLHSGRIVESYGTTARYDRWLYRGLHNFDLPWLYRNRPAWDLLVISMMTGGIFLSITGVVIGSRRIRRKFLAKLRRQRRLRRARVTSPE